MSFALNNFALNDFALKDAFVALASTQLDRQVSFYTKLLQIEPSIETDSYAEFRLPGLRIGLFSPKASHASEFAASTSGPMSLCLEVNDLESAIAHLKNLGHAPPGEVMQTSHGQEIYAYDPDGNRLILHQSPP